MELPAGWPPWQVMVVMVEGRKGLRREVVFSGVQTKVLLSLPAGGEW